MIIRWNNPNTFTIKPKDRRMEIFLKIFVFMTSPKTFYVKNSKNICNKLCQKIKFIYINYIANRIVSLTSCLTKCLTNCQGIMKIFLVIHRLEWPAMRNPHWRHSLKCPLRGELNSRIYARYSRCKSDQKSWQSYLTRLFLLIGSNRKKREIAHYNMDGSW